MAKKRKKRAKSSKSNGKSASKSSASPGKAPMMMAKSAKKKGKKRGVPAISTNFPGPSTAKFTQAVLQPVNVPAPIEPKRGTITSGQATGNRLIRTTQTNQFAAGASDSLSFVKVPTPVGKKRKNTNYLFY